MIYFDHAATSLKKPKTVLEAVYKAMQTMGNGGRGGHDASLEAGRMIYSAREALAHLFHISDPSRIAFTSNGTESLNIAIKGILQEGDHVITTAVEHNSVLRPLYELEEKGVELTIVASNEKGCISIEDIARSIQSNTKMIICTHASNVTGNLLPIKKIGEICSQQKILFTVDASQTAGVFPIDVTRQKIDILCFTVHKGLLGPQGTGGIYVREGIEITPLKSGGTGFLTFSKQQPTIMPECLEAGTLNGHGIAGLQAGVTYIIEKGLESIREKEQKLMWQFYEGIKEIPHVKIYGDFSTRERAAIVSFNIGAYDSSEVSDQLAYEYQIYTRAGGHCAPLLHETLGTKEQGAVRFSFSFYNTEEEVNYAIQAVRKLAR